MNRKPIKQALADGLVALALVACMAAPMAQLARAWHSDWRLQSAALSMSMLLQTGRRAAMDGGLDAHICWNGGLLPIRSGGRHLPPGTLVLRLADDGAELGRVALDRRLSLRSNRQTRPGDCWHYDSAGLLRQIGAGALADAADAAPGGAGDAPGGDDQEAHRRIALCSDYGSPEGGWQLTVPVDAPPSRRAARTFDDCNLEYTL